MMKKLTFPFRLAITEFKKDNAFRKNIDSKTIKSTILGFMGQSCIFFFMMSVMYIALAYILIVTIFLLEPVGLIFFPLGFVMLLFLSGYSKMPFQNRKQIF